MLFALSSKRREAASTAEEEEEEAVEFDLVMNAAWGNYVDLILARNGMRGMELEELARVVEEGGQERRDLWEKGAKREFWKVTPGKVLGLVGWTLPVAVVERAADNLKKKWARR